MRKLVSYSMALALGLFFSNSAWAACRYINGAAHETLSPSLTQLVVDPNAADRTQIGPEYQVWANVATYMNCDASPAYTQNYEMLLGAPIPGSNGLYATSMPGIAVAVAHSYNGVLYWYPYSQTYATAANWTIEPAYTNAAYRVRFFKYGNVRYGGGTIASSAIARYTVNWSGGSLPISTIVLPNIVVKTPACVISDVPVNMGSVSVGSPAWRGVGSRGPDVPFNLTIRNCARNFTGIAFTLQPVTSLVSTPEWNITLDGTSTARGVGVQVRRADNDSIVPICGTCKVAFTYNSTVGGDATLAMKANYLQTAATITPGTANSSMWFSVTYP